MPKNFSPGFLSTSKIKKYIFGNGELSKRLSLLNSSNKSYSADFLEVIEENITNIIFLIRVVILNNSE